MASLGAITHFQIKRIMILGILFILGLILYFIALFKIRDKAKSCFWSYMSGMLTIAGWWLMLIYSDGNIQPIDVYRNKTTLEITYKQVDSLMIPIDSTVVWKKNCI